MLSVELETAKLYVLSFHYEHCPPFFLLHFLVLCVRVGGVPNRCADPVFFASLCGQAGVKPPSETALTVQDAHDYRLSSLGAAVEWCKMNNLLGLLLDAELLVSYHTTDLNKGTHAEVKLIL